MSSRAGAKCCVSPMSARRPRRVNATAAPCRTGLRCAPGRCPGAQRRLWLAGGPRGVLADARYGWAPTSRAPGLATLAVPPCWYDVCALMRLSELVDTSGRVARASGRLEKVGLLAALLRRSEPDEIEITVAFLCGNLRQAK